jgi:hypothetical protein
LGEIPNVNIHARGDKEMKKKQNNAIFILGERQMDGLHDNLFLETMAFRH